MKKMQQFDSKRMSIPLEINGETRIVSVRAADTLLHVLRNQLGLTGAKPGCLNGDCGACTVNIDEMPMKSCLMLAVEATDKKVTTIEGLKNKPLQNTFIEKFAFQCGYCTPGFIMNIDSLLQNHPHATDEVIINWLESNICRCTGYQEIKETIKSMLNNKYDQKHDQINE
jgi:carbon-monoxide dehydrogenase small subunit